MANGVAQPVGPGIGAPTSQQPGQPRGGPRAGVQPAPGPNLGALFGGPVPQARGVPQGGGGAGRGIAQGLGAIGESLSETARRKDQQEFQREMLEEQGRIGLLADQLNAKRAVAREKIASQTNMYSGRLAELSAITQAAFDAGLNLNEGADLRFLEQLDKSRMALLQLQERVGTTAFDELAQQIQDDIDFLRQRGVSAGDLPSEQPQAVGAPRDLLRARNGLIRPMPPGERAIGPDGKPVANLELLEAGASAAMVINPIMEIAQIADRKVKGAKQFEATMAAFHVMVDERQKAPVRLLESFGVTLPGPDSVETTPTMTAVVDTMVDTIVNRAQIGDLHTDDIIRHASRLNPAFAAAWQSLRADIEGGKFEGDGAFVYDPRIIAVHDYLAEAIIPGIEAILKETREARTTEGPIEKARRRAKAGEVGEGPPVPSTFTDEQTGRLRQVLHRLRQFKTNLGSMEAASTYRMTLALNDGLNAYQSAREDARERGITEPPPSMLASLMVDSFMATPAGNELRDVHNNFLTNPMDMIGLIAPEFDVLAAELGAAPQQQLERMGPPSPALEAAQPQPGPLGRNIFGEGQRAEDDLELLRVPGGAGSGRR